MADTPQEFTDLPLDPALFLGLDALGHVQMTPVQAQSLPALLEGRDLIAQAPTGSGKTAAFGLALLHALDPAQIRLQALVLCPTRELADQVAKHIRKLATGIPNLKLSTLTGGMALAPQLASLAQHAPHVVVGTPGRVQELLRKNSLDLRGIRVLVLDEADRMLDMGFEEPIREIVGKTPAKRQTLLFSATYPEEIRAITGRFLRDPVEVTVDGPQQATIEQLFFEVEQAQKPAALAGLLMEHNPESTVVFCNMRRDTEQVVSSLEHLGFSALALHGEMEQRDRDEVLVRFANRSCNVLVASDVAARGLDIHDLGAVINYDLPTDPAAYVHRIGRTGRAGRSGLALTLCTPREAPRTDVLATQLGAPLRWQRAPLAALRARIAPQAATVTLRIDAGRTDKLRPGDIVGALTGDAGLSMEAIGKIDVFPTRSYVAIQRTQADKALARLQAGKIKGRKFRVRRI
ncbi:ATP-dependent RNA helicase DbpA [Lysobacter solisilvae (ex Woo and Kim 2020)]|uniref:ATP-dependent RNA helicase DbpA n=1 Tax=Agrilutibacter terrestris TaxID=2865112 RepID=A0A7H0FWY0_9GAMM|nr:ATP-dependent RNA helicase DbpA [Lysobacter terrestris]QNP40546.1 ATP-dependent RNA helicase DbpA [Lysobacter terrestris]